MDLLTAREKEIVHLIMDEKTSVQISEILQISERTVETHRKHIYLKTGVKSVVGLVKKFISTDIPLQP